MAVYIPDILKPYYHRRFELTVEGDCLLWGIRVVIPRSLQGDILHELHRDHPGMTRMKVFARSYVWWPGLDKSIEQLASSCQDCLRVKPSPPTAPLHPWIWPTKPWQRVHVDYAGPFQGKMYFLVVDAHSKWPEIFEMSVTTSTKTIGVLRHLFAQFGLPQQLVSDNGPQFTSDEFQRFMRSNGIKHIRTSPYHPASNGAAERFVRTFKQVMKAGQRDGLTPQHRLQNFLLTYRSTPHATTGEIPAFLFLRRQVRTRFDLLRPSLEQKVSNKQADQKQQHDQHVRLREFVPGDKVLAKNRSEWIPAVVLQKLGPLTYLIDVGQGRTWRRHIDLLKKIPSDITSSDFFMPSPETAEDSTVDSPAPTVTASSEESTTTDSSSTQETVPALRRSTRIRREPDRYHDTYMYT